MSNPRCRAERPRGTVAPQSGTVETEAVQSNELSVSVLACGVSRGTLPDRGFRAGSRRELSAFIPILYYRAFPILGSGRDMPEWDDRGFGMFHRDTRRTLMGAVVGGSVSIVALAFVFFVLGVSWPWVLLFAALAPVELVVLALLFRER